VVQAAEEMEPLGMQLITLTEQEILRLALQTLVAVAAVDMVRVQILHVPTAATAALVLSLCAI
jgi:hypothetical protein